MRFILIFAWILCPLWGQNTASAPHQTDPWGRPVHQDGTFYNYVVGENGTEQIQMSASREILGRVAVATSEVVPIEPLVGLDAACSDNTAEWTYALYGSGIGDSGFLVGDFNNNGLTEIILCGSSNGGFSANDFWHVIEYDGEGYRQIYVGVNYGEMVQKLFMMDDVDGEPVFGVAFRSGRVVTYNAATYHKLDEVTLPVNRIYDLVAANLDGTGSPEWVVTDGTDLHIFQTQPSLTRTQHLAGKGGFTLAVGQLDRDPALEMVTEPSDGRGYMIDGATTEVEWDYALGFGSLLTTGDIDGDGLEEIVGGESWYEIRAFDGDQGIEKWSHRADLDVHVVRTADVDGDGVLEVVYGDGQWGSIHFLQGNSGDPFWAVRNPRHGVTDLAIADVDGDQQLEVLWGGGHTSTGPDQLFVAGIPQQEIEWQSVVVEGGLGLVSTGDLDDDGIEELLVCSGEGLLHVFDGASKEIIRLFSIYEGFFFERINDIQVADVDADGEQELVILTGDSSRGLLQVYNAATFELEWSAGRDHSLEYYAMSLTNLDEDDALELIVGDQVRSTGASGTRFRIYDGATGDEQWVSPYLANGFAGVVSLLAMDVTEDGTTEIFALTGNALYVFDAASNQLIHDAPIRGSVLAAGDPDRDGETEILVGTTGGSVEILNGEDFSVEDTLVVFDGNIRAFSLHEMTGDGRVDWVAASDDALVVVDGFTRDQVWQAENCQTGLAVNRRLSIGDLDGDHQVEITMGSRNSVRVFEPAICTPQRMMQALPNWPNGETVLSIMTKMCQPTPR